jgi:hypothetical protein
MTYKENSNTFLNYSEIPCPIIDYNAYLLPENSGIAIGYYSPRAFTPPGEMTGKTIVYDKGSSSLRGLISKGAYLYYADTYGMHRKLISGGDEETLFDSTEYYDGYETNMDDMSFSLVNDGRHIKVIMIRNYDYDNGDYRLNIVIREFGTNRNTSMGDLPFYTEDETGEYVYYFCVPTSNNRLVLSGYTSIYHESPALDEYIFNIWIYDIVTGELLYENHNTIVQGWYFFQYPICPPVIIGNNVYIEYHFGASEENYDYDRMEDIPNSTPVVFNVNTENLSVNVARPTIDYDGYNRYLSTLYQAAYDESINSLVFIYERFNYTEIYGDDAHYGIMLMDLSDLTVTFPWEVRYAYHYPAEPGDEEPTDEPRNLLVAPNNTIYLIKEDGSVVLAKAPTTTIITIPVNNYYNWSGIVGMDWRSDYAQPMKICNIVDNSGIIWMCYRGDIRGYNIAGGDPIIVEIDIPEPSSGPDYMAMFEPFQLVYLLEGRLYIMNRDYYTGYTVWVIDQSEYVLPTYDACKLRNSGDNRDGSIGYGIQQQTIWDTSVFYRRYYSLIYNKSNINTNWVCNPTAFAYNDNFVYYQHLTDVSFSSPRNLGENGIICIREMTTSGTNKNLITVGEFGKGNTSRGICMAYLEPRKVLVGVKTPTTTNPIYLLDFQYGDWQYNTDQSPEECVLYATVNDMWSMLVLRKSDGDLWIYVNSYRRDISGNTVGYSVSFQNYTENSSWNTIEYEMDVSGEENTYEPYTPCFIGDNYLVWAHSYQGGKVRAYSLNLNTNTLQTSASLSGSVDIDAMHIYSAAPDNYNHFAVFTTAANGWIKYYPLINSIELITEPADVMALSTNDNAYILQSSTGKIYRVYGLKLEGTLPLDSDAIWNNISNLIDERPDPAIWWLDWETKNLKRIAFDGTVTQVFTWSATNYSPYTITNQSNCILAGNTVIATIAVQATSGSYGWDHYMIW